MPDAIAHAFEEGDEVVIESFLSGREVTCGVIHDGNELLALPITELIPEGEYFDYDAKYEGKSQEITPADIPDEWRKNLQDVSKRIYRRIGLTGITRMDYIVSKDGTIYLIEVNTNPGFSPASIVPQQLEANGQKITPVLTAVINSVL